MKHEMAERKKQSLAMEMDKMMKLKGEKTTVVVAIGDVKSDSMQEEMMTVKREKMKVAAAGGDSSSER